MPLVQASAIMLWVYAATVSPSRTLFTGSTHAGVPLDLRPPASLTKDSATLSARCMTIRPACHDYISRSKMGTT